MDKVKAFNAVEISHLQPIRDKVIVSDMQFNERFSAGGIVILNDNGKIHGIRPRWGKVYAVGPEQTDVKIGQWILVSHGRWTRGVKIEDSNGEQTLRMVDNKDILLVSDEEVHDEIFGRPL
jgi:co-chaperonin GroES (HSP10)